MFFYFIYKTTNLINNRIYIGSHKSTTLEFDGYFGSNVALKNAISKYGKENFKREILEIILETNTQLSNQDWVDLIFPVESKWIKFYASENLYNININAAWGGSTTHGRQWIHNPSTGEQYMIPKSDIIPENFIKGRIVGDWNEKQKGRKIYTNDLTGIEKSFKSDPGYPWVKGSKKDKSGRKNPSYNKKWYMNVELKQYCYTYEVKSPPGFIPGHPDFKHPEFRSTWTKIAIQ